MKTCCRPHQHFPHTEAQRKNDVCVNRARYTNFAWSISCFWYQIDVLLHWKCLLFGSLKYCLLCACKHFDVSVNDLQHDEQCTPPRRTPFVVNYAIYQLMNWWMWSLCPWYICFTDNTSQSTQMFEETCHEGVHTYDVQLDPRTALLAKNCEAINIFVNDQCGRDTIEVLAKQGVKIITLRCATGGVTCILGRDCWGKLLRDAKP